MRFYYYCLKIGRKLWRAKAHKLAESGSKAIRTDGIIKVERATELCSVVVKTLKSGKEELLANPAKAGDAKLQVPTI